MCYSLWYNAAIAMPAGSLKVEELRFQATGRQQLGWIIRTTSSNTQSSAPEDGRDCRLKHVELIGIINL